eukprot:4188331-Amphidinium_carterae.1
MSQVGTALADDVGGNAKSVVHCCVLAVEIVGLQQKPVFATNVIKNAQRFAHGFSRRETLATC